MTASTLPHYYNQPIESGMGCYCQESKKKRRRRKLQSSWLLHFGATVQMKNNLSAAVRTRSACPQCGENLILRNVREQTCISWNEPVRSLTTECPLARGLLDSFCSGL